MKTLIEFLQMQFIALLIVTPLAACFVPFGAGLWAMVVGAGLSAFLLARRRPNRPDIATKA